MSIAKVLAPVTGVPRDATVIRAAIAAAKPFKAHVVALFVRPDSRLSVPYMGGAPMSPKVVDHPAKAAEVTCSFEAIIGLFPPRIAEAASLSDLVVFGPLSHDDGPDI